MARGAVSCGLPADATTPNSSYPSSISAASSGVQGDPNISYSVSKEDSQTPSTTMSGHVPTRVLPVDASLLAGGSRALCSIALHGFAVGTALGSCIFLTIYLLHHGYLIWRLPQFIATLAIFHFLEFYTTSRWNTVNAKVSSYLLFSNGAAYNVAHAAAMLEIIVSSLLLPDWQAKFCNPLTVTVGAVLVVLGQIVRSVAMAKAGKSFNHIPQKRKRDDHVLVTGGIYSWSRHPSYFGYYWFAVGSQIVVGNKICAVVYAVVLWSFFKNRIPGELYFLFLLPWRLLLLSTDLLEQMRNNILLSSLARSMRFTRRGLALACHSFDSRLPFRTSSIAILPHLDGTWMFTKRQCIALGLHFDI